jgi:hypothetical protein
MDIVAELHGIQQILTTLGLYVSNAELVRCVLECPPLITSTDPPGCPVHPMALLDVTKGGYSNTPPCLQHLTPQLPNKLPSSQ